MKATVFRFLSVMCWTMAVAMWASFWADLKTQCRLASIGSTTMAEPAMEIMGVSLSAATSIMASEFGVVLEPMTTSTLFSLISFLMFLVAAVGSVASSRTM